ncbi:MAG: hypothetical protein OCD76_16990 [Reichenbachiella sp.]
MKKLLITIGLVGCLMAPSFADDNVSGLIRSNINWDVDNSETQFAITRAYVTLKKTYDNGVMARITLDMAGKPIDYPNPSKMPIVLKYGYFSMPVIDKLTATIGLQPSLSYIEPYKLFGYAYVGYNPITYSGVNDGTSSSDGGASLKYKATEDVTVKAGVFSGNSYSKMGKHQDFVYAVNAGYKKGVIQANIYGSVKPYNGTDVIVTDDGSYETEMQTVVSPFVGVKLPDFRAGGVFALEINKDGSDADGSQVKALEVFAASKVIDKVEAFATYSRVWTDADKTAQNKTFLGLQYAPEKQIKLAIKYAYQFDDKNVKDGVDAAQQLGLFTKVAF